MASTPSSPLCPACLRNFKAARNDNPRMVRHGFRAFHVRHGETGGFHTGNCPGTGQARMGTEAGNAFALGQATGYDAEALRQEALPVITLEDATQNAISDAIAGMAQRYTRPGAARLSVAELTAKYATPEAFRGTSYSGWFAPSAIIDLARRLTYQRGQRIAELRAAAVALRQAIAEHPPA